MKKIIFALLLVSFSGCSRAYVRKWDRNQVTACCPHGNMVCSNEKLREVAVAKCGCGVTEVGGGLVESGSEVYSGYGGATITSTNDSCTTFRCDR